jgi:hypothetical protein
VGAPGQDIYTDGFYMSAAGGESGPYTYQQLQQFAVNGQLRAEHYVRRASGGQWFMAKEVPYLFSDKEWMIALILSVLIGTLGIDRFYLGQVPLGLLKLFTGGGCGVWWLIDVILIAMRKLPDADGRPLR